MRHSGDLSIKWMQNSRNCRRFILIVCARYDAATVIINILKKLKKGEESPKGEARTANRTTQHRETVTMRGNLLLRIAPNDSSGSGIARCAPLNGEPESRWVSSVGGEWMVQNIGKGIASGSMVRPHT